MFRRSTSHQAINYRYKQPMRAQAHCRNTPSKRMPKSLLILIKISLKSLLETFPITLLQKSCRALQIAIFYREFQISKIIFFGFLHVGSVKLVQSSWFSRVGSVMVLRFAQSSGLQTHVRYVQCTRRRWKHNRIASFSNSLNFIFWHAAQVGLN